MSSGLGNLVPDHISGLGRLLLHPWIPPQASGQGTDLVIPFASGSRAENIRSRPHSHNQKPSHPYRSPRLVVRSIAGLPTVAFRLGLGLALLFRGINGTYLANQRLPHQV